MYAAMYNVVLVVNLCKFRVSIDTFFIFRKFCKLSINKVYTYVNLLDNNYYRVYSNNRECDTNDISFYR